MPVKITGCTVHIVCLEVDSGPILLKRLAGFADDTPETLREFKSGTPNFAASDRSAC